ncbi:MAG: hypothetical protein ABWY54_06670 [Glaciihabitans sp.]
MRGKTVSLLVIALAVMAVLVYINSQQVRGGRSTAGAPALTGAITTAGDIVPERTEEAA